MRFASGETPHMSDVNQLLSSLPNMVVQIPGLGNVDISKVYLNKAQKQKIIRWILDATSSHRTRIKGRSNSGYST